MAAPQQSSSQDQRDSTRIICAGGLDSTQNHLNLSANKPGAATVLVNYEVGLTGGYRRINGFLPYSATHAEVGVGVAEGAVLGIIIYELASTGVIQIMAARKDLGVNRYHLYLFTSGTGWVQINDGLTHVYTSGSFTVEKLRWDVSNNNAENVLAFVDGVNPATLYDGTTWGYVQSASTGADMAHAGGAQVVNAPTFVTFFSKTLFLAGDEVNTARGVVSYSAPNAFYDFTAASGGGQLTSGLLVNQIKQFRDSLYIFSKHGIKKAVANTTSGFLLSDVTSNIGCIASDSVLEIGGDLVFLAPDGIRPVSGTDKIGDVQLESISKPAQLMITTLTQSSPELSLNGVVVRSKSQFRYFIGNDTSAVPDSVGIIGGLRDTSTSYTSAGYVSNGWEFGQLQGIRASCVTSRYVGSQELVLHGDYDGCVYQQEVGESFNGSKIVSVYSTPYLDFGEPDIRKVFDKINVFIRGEGTLVMGLRVDYDWGAQEAAARDPQQYVLTIDASQVQYDEAGVTYGGANEVYGGILATRTLADIQGSFFSTRLTFTTGDTTSASFSIHAAILEFSFKGRR